MWVNELQPRIRDGAEYTPLIPLEGDYCQTNGSLVEVEVQKSPASPEAGFPVSFLPQTKENIGSQRWRGVYPLDPP